MTKQYTIGNDTNVLLDSGNTFNYLNADVTDQIYTDLGAELNAAIGYPLVDCAKQNMTGSINFGFGNGTIAVAFSDFIFAVEELRAVGLLPIADGSQQILGVPFLRSAYGKVP